MGGQDGSGSLPRRVQRLHAVVVTSAVVVFALPVPAELAAVSFAVIGLATVAALLAGPRLNGVRTKSPWRLIALAAFLFGAGATVRPAAIEGSLPLFAPDLLIVPGFVLTAVALSRMRPRSARLDVHAAVDGLIMTTSAAMLAVVFLAVPAARVEGRPTWLSVLSALYPVFDVVLVMVLAYLAFTRQTRSRSFVLLSVAIGSLLLGDLGYAVVGRTGALQAPAWVDVFFAVAYLCLGAAALDPSVRSIEVAPPRVVQAWSSPRLALLGAALAVPPAVILVGTESLTARITLAAGSAAILAMVVLRATRAVRDFARTQHVFRHQATHDPLTNLPNRTAVHERLTELLAGPAAADVQLLFLDLDGFKLVNDSWGHDVGDELLVAAAARLRACAPPDSMVGRAGGDEFLMVLRSPDPVDGLRAAEQVLHSLREPFRLSVAEVVVSASVGVAVARGAVSLTPDALVRDADTAMYRAKAGGRQRCVLFEPSMRDEVRTRVELELALRHAVGTGQLRLHYQPIMSLGDGRMVKVEALLRWWHPVLGNVPPSDFIPLAEETGLIVEIGDWVVAEGVRQLAAWRETRPDVRIALSVNVSGRQLRNAGFAQRVRDLLVAQNLDPALLCVEVTESVVVGNDPHVADNLEVLHADGVRLSVDDFGTGYSSLSYLRRLPVDEVKIDHTFVGGLGSHEEDVEIVRATVAMGHALGLVVVAEGVETQAQADQLRALDVDLAQGWLYGRPVPPEELMPTAGGASATAGLPGVAQVHDR